MVAPIAANTESVSATVSGGTARIRVWPAAGARIFGARTAQRRAEEATQSRVPHPDLPLAQLARKERDRHRNLIRQPPGAAARRSR